MNISKLHNARYLASLITVATVLAALSALYLGALLASLFLFVSLLQNLLHQGPGFFTIAGLLLSAATASLLSGVLIRGYLRRETLDRSEFIELHPHDEPELFIFLEDLCRRTKVPMPHRVFTAPNVNAGVFFDTSGLNLLWPLRKNLLIGLGMVNALNRTEFEAVLAHEFGHFSQLSMRQSYLLQLWSALLEQLISAPQTMEPILHRLNGLPFRAFGVAPLTYTFHKMSRPLGEIIIAHLQRLDASISRQMELQADQVALDLTGSDALTHALLRTDWAERCFNQTLYDLEHTAQAGLRSQDLYFHQDHLMHAMRERLKDPSLGIPPPLPEDPTKFHWIFSKDEPATPPAQLWQTHPPHHLRERFAKENYRRTHFDERRAWTLFSNPAALRARQTALLYSKRWDAQSTPLPPSQVQRYIDGEHQELILNPLEQLVFGHRFLEPGDFHLAMEQAAAGKEQSDEDLRQWLQDLTGPKIDEAAQRLTRHITPMKLPSQRPIARAFRGSPQGDPSQDGSSSGRPTPEDSAEDDRLWLARFDRDILIATLRAAKRCSDETHEELIRRYSFHLHLQDLIRWMRAHSAQFPPLLEAISSPDQSDELQQQIFGVLLALHSGLQTGLHSAPPLPSLHGLPPEATLSTLAIDQPLIDATPLTQGTLDDQWLSTFLEQWQEASNRLDHLRRKSLGALLLFQKQIIAPWLSSGKPRAL